MQTTTTTTRTMPLYLSTKPDRRNGETFFRFAYRTLAGNWHIATVQAPDRLNAAQKLQLAQKPGTTLAFKREIAGIFGRGQSNG